MVSYGTGIQLKNVSCPHTTHPDLIGALVVEKRWLHLTMILQD